MNELTVISQNGKLLVDSREVAEMVDKRHDHLLRDIKGYIDILEKATEPKIGVSDFFIASAYKDVRGRALPHYLLTRKGCDMVANKLTGGKGVIFTAMYVTKFEEMEKQLQAPMQQLSPQLQVLINIELNQKRLEEEILVTKQEVRTIRDTIIINPKAEWRKECNRILNTIGMKLGDFESPKVEAYEALRERAKCRPKVLVTNLRERALKNGMAPSKALQLNILDVLENEPRLREIYIVIVKEMAIKYQVPNKKGDQ